MKFLLFMLLSISTFCSNFIYRENLTLKEITELLNTIKAKYIILSYDITHIKNSKYSLILEIQRKNYDL